MDAEDDQATDEDVFVDLETALGDFPHLKAIMPATYPRASRFKISRDAIKSYSDARAKQFWHNLNLPLLLHSYRHNPDSRARELFKSLLKTLDDFADRLGHLQGARSLLRPLWDDPWTGTPQLWSIAGCAYVALCYLTDKIEIIGFESPISGTLKDDITVRLDGRITHVEVEAHHLAEFGDRTDAEVLAELERRADEKAGKKFSDIAADHVGVVAVVCVATGNDVERRIHAPVTALPNRGKNVGWTAWSLVGIAHPDGPRFALLWL